MRKIVADSAKCTGCGVCEDVCSMAFYKVKDRAKSAIRVTECDDGGYRVTICDQCGVCRGMCSMMSLMTAKNGVVRLDKKTCVGCLICVAECPCGCMFYHDDLPTPFKCEACGLCARKCPAGALEIESKEIL
ncbi:MAG: 4Fe-4S binding protein [Oscillospiraceae bacterium]|jgi:Fe-S-cluster-containing hydrogenase component 2|nr:4Fe-4S binding protein [Oscillospiraceae bacterium]